MGNEEISSICTICGSNYHYKTFCPKRGRKPISKIGKEAKKYRSFHRDVAVPYLDKVYGHICSVSNCNVTYGLEIDHIKTRGARHDLKYDLSNLRYLCRKHHQMQTIGKLY